MPPRVDPKDWNHLFRPNAPRRGGPLRALATLLVAGALLSLIGGFVSFGLGAGRAQIQAAATANAQTAAAQAVVVQTQNAAVIATRTAAAATPTAAPTEAVAEQPIGTGQVVAGGNLRSSPGAADDTTIIGQICIGDQIAFLEQTDLAGSIWYRIRVTATGPDCTATRVTVGSGGWASATLLSQPAP